MSHPPDTLRSIDYVRVFPWLRMGRATGCALAPQSWALSFLVALLGWCVTRNIPTAQVITLIDQPSANLGEFSYLSWLLPHLAKTAVYPEVTIIRPLLQGIQLQNAWSVWALLQAAGMFAAWTIAGVAIVRCTAQQFCRDDGASLRTSVQWSFRRIPVSLSSMLTPIGGMVFGSVVLGVLLLPGVIPALGILWLKLTAPLAVLLGTGIASIGLLLLILWPLMVAAVAIDDTDSFGAFSRSFSYVTTHVWSTIALLLVHLLAAMLVIWAIEVVFSVGYYFVVWMAEFFVKTDPAEPFAGHISHLMWWSGLFQLGLIGSLFWSHVTIIYLYLRRAVDGTPVDVLAGYEDDMKIEDAYPVVGMPAAKPFQISAE